MKYFVFTLLISILLINCKRNIETQNACISAYPIEDVVWLKEIKANMTNCGCEISIIQGTYSHQTVFFVGLTDPLCDGIDIPTLFDCTGNVVRTFTDKDYQEFYKNVTRDKVLYRCKKNK
jgi:hypothetical protein